MTPVLFVPSGEPPLWPGCEGWTGLRVSSIQEVLRAVLITTMNDIPGYAIDEVYGEVFGLTVRSRNIGSQFGAGLKSLLGGELKGMTKALVDSRGEVTQRMVEEAELKGANAIVAMRFDTSEMGANWTEICAYGTAVTGPQAVAPGAGPAPLRLAASAGHEPH